MSNKLDKLKEHFEENRDKSGWYAIADEIVLVNKGKKCYKGNRYRVYDESGRFVYLCDLNLTDDDLAKEEEVCIGCEPYPESVFTVHKSDVSIVGYINMENE